MKWTCADPATLAQYGLRLRQSRTFATPQPAVARTWPARYRYGLRALGWLPPMATYKLDLFTTAGEIER